MANFSNFAAPKARFSPGEFQLFTSKFSVKVQLFAKNPFFRPKVRRKTPTHFKVECTFEAHSLNIKYKFIIGFLY